MKSDVMHSRVQLEAAILKNLVTEVKETVATDVVIAKSRKSTFGAVQLWNIRRKSRFGAYPRKNPAIVTGIGY